MKSNSLYIYHYYNNVCHVKQMFPDHIIHFVCDPFGCSRSHFCNNGVFITYMYFEHGAIHFIKTFLYLFIFVSLKIGCYTRHLMMM